MKTLECQSLLILRRSKDELLRGLWRIYKTESLSGWFKGMATPLIGNAMVYGLMFGINELALSMESVDKDNPWHHVISGFFGGTVQCAIGSPVELAKIKLQVQGIGINYRIDKTYHRQYMNSIQCLYVIGREQGLKGFYRGLLSTLVRDGPGFAVQLGTYEYLVRLKGINGNEERLLYSCLFGAICGCFGWTSIYPIDTIKTEFQAKEHYKSYLDVVKFLAQSEKGLIGSLFNGYKACMLRSMAQSSTIFFTLEAYRYLLR